MNTIISTLDKEIGPSMIQPLFISLDPWRDSVEQIATYIKAFSPRLIGLTGTPEQCLDVAKKFRVYTTTDRPDTGDEEDYSVDHSIWMYLLDKEGKFVDLFAVNMEWEEVTEKIMDHLIMRNEIKESLWRKTKNFFKVN